MSDFRNYGDAVIIDAGRVRRITQNVTWDNVKVIKDGMLQPANGVTVTITGFNEIPGDFKWVDESRGGTVTFTTPVYNNAWKGAAGGTVFTSPQTGPLIDRGGARVNIKAFRDLVVADNWTAALNAAHAEMDATIGGVIEIPQGVFLLDTWPITKQHVSVIGAGMQSTVLRRRTDSSDPLVWFNGSRGSRMAGVTLQDVNIATPTNTGNLLELYIVNDMMFDGCWLQFGHKLAYVGIECGNIAFVNTMFESGRRFNAHLVQCYDTRFTGCTFYTPGRAVATASAPHDGTGASLMIENNVSYSYYPFEHAITGCSFINTNHGHHIRAKQVAGLSITGNVFGGAGLFDAGVYDEVKLESCRYVSVVGNTSSGEWDGYGNPPPRKSRFNVNIDAGCRNVVVGPNAFRKGTHGYIQDLAPDTSRYRHTVQRSIVAGANPADDTDGTVLADSSAGTAFYGLPLAIGRKGQRYTVIRTNTGANNVVLESQAGDTIIGAGNYQLTAQYQRVTVESDGANTWYIVAS